MEHSPRLGLSFLLPVSRRLFARHILLRRFRKADAAELLALWQNNREWLSSGMSPLPDGFSEPDMQLEIRKRQRLEQKGRRLDLAICDQTDQQCLGEVSIHSLSWGIQLSGGLGFWIDQDFASRGLMKEAVATACSFAFEESPLHRIWAASTLQNTSSQRVLKALGFKQDGTLRQELFLEGRWQDMLHFSLLRDEYDQLAETWIKSGFLGSSP